jgi:predicted ATPase/class 3 adenylate cyclase
MTKLPTGTVTFLFTDIEGSTKLLHQLGERYREVQSDHQRLMREAIGAHNGHEMRTEGDSFFVVFPSAADAVACSIAAQQALTAHPWSHGEPLRVRMGMHTGEGQLLGDDYLSIDVNRAARIGAAGHGEQVLLSSATRSLVERDLPDGVTIRSLGAHRLKDFPDPEPLHDLVIDGLSSEFPPLKSLEAPTNLPAELTTFVGRESEVARVAELLGSRRLVTMTGPGGTGKTRLAMETARQLVDRFPDGVFFVELAAISAPELVVSTIARTLGLREEGSRPVLETLSGHLRGRHMLLVLDNFEQVLDAAPVVSTLLSEAEGVRILVTSRSGLHIRGEQEFPVPPLELPDPATTSAAEIVSRSAAVALFAERAAQVDPGFEVTDDNAAAVARICARLDGLPLAIELAASRLKLLPPAQMLQRLDRALPLLSAGARDLPDRQRTLRAAIGWSHDLLEEPERVLFRRLGVFAGGWNLEAAEHIAGANGDSEVDALTGLGALVDRSLVRGLDAADGGHRFDMLQTIREFGLEQLEEAGEASTIRQRHAMYMLTLAEEAAPYLRGIDQKRWLDALEVEHDNLRAALGWAVETDEGEIALRLVAALWRFWHLHGHIEEGRRWAASALALPSAAPRTGARSDALAAAGSLAYWQLDVPAVAQAYGEAFSIAGELDDPQRLAETTYLMVFPSALQGDLPGAIAMTERARSAFQGVGDRRGFADALWVQSLLERLQGDLSSSRRTAEESLRLQREVQDRFGMMDALHMLGRAAFGQGDLETFRKSFLETLEVHAEVGNRTGIAIALDNLAAQEMARGRPERAVRMAGASDAIKESAGGAAPTQFVDLPDPRDAARDVIGEQATHAAWEDGRAMSMPEAIDYARQED